MQKRREVGRVILKAAVGMLAIGAVVGMLGGCGGGGGGGAAPAATTTVSGVVSKGIFTDGTVQFYEVLPGGGLSYISGADATIGANGTPGGYSANLGKLVSGPIVVKAFGHYLDEATQQSVQVSASAPLRAVVPAASVATTAAVTPLTDLAADKLIAGNAVSATATAIDNTNKSVGALFGVADIVKTQPVPFTAAALQNTADGERRAYTEVLALVSQYVKNHAASTSPADLQSSLQMSLAALSGGISASSTGDAAQITTAAVGTGLKSASADATTNPYMKDTMAVDSSAGTTLQTALSGTKTVTYTLNVDDGNTVADIDGIQVDITLPAALALPDGEVSSSVLASSGVYSGNGFLIGNVKSGVLTIGLVTTSTFGSGNFGTLTFTVPMSTTAPAALSLANTTVTDPSLKTLSATVTAAAY